MRCYKVVREKDDRLWSVLAPPEYEVMYQVDEWVEAPVGGLLCFEREKDARLFAMWGRAHHVFLAEGERQVPLPRGFLPAGIWDAATSDLVTRLWRYERWPRLVPWEPGTVAYRRVKLLRELDG